MPEIKRTFAIKLVPTTEQEAILKNLFKQFGECVRLTFGEIERIRNSYQTIPEAYEDTCSRCNERMKIVRLQNSKPICQRCFINSWSHFTLVNKDGWLKNLREFVPEEVYSVTANYYTGAIKFAVENYKSYLTKIEERQREIRRLEEEVNTCTNPKRQQELLKKIGFKSRPLKDIEFRNNVLSFGGTSMFDFKEEEWHDEFGNVLQDTGKFFMGISDPTRKKSTKQTRIWIPISVGAEKDYHTDHNKYNLLREMIRTDDHKSIYAKILYRTKTSYPYYELMFPKKDKNTSLSVPKEIIEYVQKEENNPRIAVISFAIRPCATVGIFDKNGKLLSLKTIRDGGLWNFVQKNRKLRARISFKLAKKYADSKWAKNKHRKKIFLKRMFSERNAIKTYTHTVTKLIVRYLKRECPNGCVVVSRDTTGVKRINYPPIYMKVLSAWNVELQNTIFNYKSQLKGFHLFHIPYTDSKDLSCSRCKTVIKKDKKPLKILTTKLSHVINKKGELLDRINNIQSKKQALLKYPNNDNIVKWMRDLAEKGTELERVYRTVKDEPSYHQITCACGYRQDFYVNDVFTLHSTFRDGFGTATEHASVVGG